MLADHKCVVTWESIPYIDFQLILFQRVCQLRQERSVQRADEVKGILIRARDDDNINKADQPERKKVRFDESVNVRDKERDTYEDEQSLDPAFLEPLGSPYNKYPFYPFDISFPIPSSAEILAEIRAQKATHSVAGCNDLDVTCADCGQRNSSADLNTKDSNTVLPY
ncbi:hypothetical protein EYR40_007756 [Pleurotus pulmonarius]|nr:hypothetical protein EYR38_007931 [Pleurotus pulmonarius]KAF4597304.1 hypothetical protein EYR40_007756 [Pleurotus pulmonarius]